MYGEGNVLSERERLTIEVIGTRRESRHALSRKVGMTSRVQEELEDLFMAAWTSAVVAGAKCDRTGGKGVGRGQA